jgi:Protein of unknown function (DUF1634)
MRDIDFTRLETMLGRVLLGGVLSAAGCLAAGLALWLAGSNHSGTNALLTAGLMILMATPILRVIVSLVEYVRMRDWFFVVATTVVLLVLFVTIAVAISSARTA